MINYPSVSVVILNWNGKRYLEKFLPSICASTYPNLSIVIGDNASSDDSLAFLKNNYPQVTIISNNQNYGFAGGYNEVLNQINSDYYILLNSDVEVEPDWIEPVIRLMESDPKIAAAQPKIRSYKKNEYFEYAGAAGGFIDTFGYPFCRGRIFHTLEPDEGQYNEATEIFWASGAALFIKTRIWTEIGGLDADFFAHMEEIDLCWRLKNKGYKIMYCPESIVYHVGGGTLEAENPYKTYLNFRNSLYTLQKNLPFFKASIMIFSRLWLDILPLLKYYLDGKPQNALAISKAHLHFLTNIFKTAKKSRAIKTAAFNSTGFYKGSVVWQYFVKKKLFFSDYKKLSKASR